jgi:hypothetical protein
MSDTQDRAEVGSAAFTMAALLSASKSGALTTFLHQDLAKIDIALSNEDNQYSKIVASEVLLSFNHNLRRQYCVQRGLYQFITKELVHYLSVLKDGVTIEVGSGNGLLAAALDIPATDNRMQERSVVIARYLQAGQTPIAYGSNVELLDGHKAKEKYQPNVIVSVWLTGNKGLSGKQLNMYGYNLKSLASGVTFVLVGNEFTHADCIPFGKACWEVSAAWIISRGEYADKNRIWVWGNKPPEIMGAIVRRGPAKGIS